MFGNVTSPLPPPRSGGDAERAPKEDSQLPSGLAPFPITTLVELLSGNSPAISSQFKNNYFTEICSGFEAGLYSRLKAFVCHSTLESKSLRVIK